MIQKMLRKIFKASLRVIFLIIIGCLLGVYDGLRLSKEEEAEEKDSKSVIHVPFDTIKSSPDTNMAIKSSPDTNMAIKSLPDTNVATTPFTIDGSTSSFLTKQSFVTKQFTEEVKESKTKESTSKANSLPVDRNTCSGGACNHGNGERSLDSIMAVSVSTGSHYSHSTGNRNKAASQFPSASFKEGQFVCQKGLPYLFRIDKINTNEAKEKCTLEVVTPCDTKVTADLLVPCDGLKLFQRDEVDADDLSKTDNTCPGDRSLLKDCPELSDGQRTMFDQLRRGKDEYITSLEGMKTEIVNNLEKNARHNDHKKEAESFIKAYGTDESGVYKSILDSFQHLLSSQDQNSIKREVIWSYDEAEELANEALQTAVNPITLDELREENQMWNDKNPSIDTWVVWFSKYKFEVHSYHKGAKAMLYMLAMLVCLPSIAYFSGKFRRAVEELWKKGPCQMSKQWCHCICFCIAYAECFDDQNSHGCSWKIWPCVSKSLRCGCACCVAHVGLYSERIVRAIQNEKPCNKETLLPVIFPHSDANEKRDKTPNPVASKLNKSARYLNRTIDKLKSSGCIFKQICPDGSSEIRCLYDILLCTIGVLDCFPLCCFLHNEPSGESEKAICCTPPYCLRPCSMPKYPSRSNGTGMHNLDLIGGVQSSSVVRSVNSFADPTLRSAAEDPPQFLELIHTPTSQVVDAEVQDDYEYRLQFFWSELSLKLGVFLFFVMLINFAYTYGP